MADTRTPLLSLNIREFIPIALVSCQRVFATTPRCSEVTTWRQIMMYSLSSYDLLEVQLLLLKVIRQWECSTGHSDEY